MSLLISTSRRRKLLFAAAAIAAGSYASYCIYNSSSFARRRRRLLQIIHAASLCCEAVSEGAESISILSKDLKSFLLSDDDDVPQSLKQAFKIGQSEEFQGTVTVLSAALTRGLLRGANGKPMKQGHKHMHANGTGQPVRSRLRALPVKDIDVEGEDVACREIREVCFTTKTQEQLRSDYDKEYIPVSNGSDCQEWEIKSYSSARKVAGVPDKSWSSKPSDDWVDKLFSKLFSESGVGFASAVTGTLARNSVLACFDAAHEQSSNCKDSGSPSSENVYTKVVDMANTTACRMLITECIQNFISTAVTVYMDKTKDVNFYNDMVAGITNPSHRDPMKDVLTAICNGAVETLVKTSYGVMTAESERQNRFTPGQRDVQEYSPFISVQGQLRSTTDAHQGCGSSSNGPSDWQPDCEEFSTARDSLGRLDGNSSKGMQSFIEGVSKTLAIPSNRKLVVDVAGSMSSEAVRAFVNVITCTASNHITSKVHGSWDKFKHYVSDQQGLQLQKRSRDMAVKAFVLASVCLAICLHMLTGLQISR